jgi:peptidoglycan/LPS O-acetylase OafA/YrhL
MAVVYRWRCLLEVLDCDSQWGDQVIRQLLLYTCCLWANRGYGYHLGDVMGAISTNQHKHYELRYRSHIDGLRAIAVMGVVLYHFGLSELPGGFIGVDVFFVISGFLISKSIFRDVTLGQFSFGDFYERRARRILPAFFVVSGISAVLAYFILFPQGLVALSKSLIAAMLFSGNIYFYATSDYFSPAATQIPLLHLWSLGVEEQFYFLFPIFVIGVHKWFPKYLGWILASLIVVSIVSSELMLGTDPAAAFYLLPFRAFELLIGSWFALPQTRFPIDRSVSNLAVATGLCLIIGGMLFTSEKMPFPGVAALVPCVGTALVIWGGEKVNSIPLKILGSKPMAFLGAISYSLYLIHWPIAVFGKNLFSDANRWNYLIVGVTLSISLAWLSYRYVEQPVRQRQDILPRRRLLVGSAASLLVFVSVFMGTITAQGFPGRITGQINQVLAYLKYDPTDMFQMGTCFMNPEQSGQNYLTDTCIPKGRPTVVLWGDSSIAQFYSGLKKPLNERGYQIGQITSSGCAPTISVDVPSRPNCNRFNDFAISEIIKVRPDILVLGAVWSQEKNQIAGLDRALRVLQENNIKTIVFGLTPRFKRAVPTIIAERLKDGLDGTLSGSELETGLFAHEDFMASHLKDGSVRYVSILNNMCPDQQCRIMTNGAPMHFDTLHLSQEGANYYGIRLVDLILN